MTRQLSMLRTALLLAPLVVCAVEKDNVPSVLEGGAIVRRNAVLRFHYADGVTEELELVNPIALPHNANPPESYRR